MRRDRTSSGSDTAERTGDTAGEFDGIGSDGGNAETRGSSGSSDGDGGGSVNGRDDSRGSGESGGVGSGITEDGSSGATVGSGSVAVGSDGDAGTGGSGGRKRGRRRRAGGGSGGSGGAEESAGDVRPDAVLTPEPVKRGARGGKRTAKGKGTAVTTAALIQFGSGTVAYATKMPHLEYSEEESNLLGDAMAEAFGTLSSKKAKAINAFLSKWGPWISLGGVVMATTMPKYQMTRAVLAERRAANRERARNAVHTREAQAGTYPAAVGVEAAPGGMGGTSAGAGIGIEGTDSVTGSFGTDFGSAG